MSVNAFIGNHMALAFLWCYMSEIQNLLLQNLIVFLYSQTIVFSVLI